jgi:hypothetical protein
MSLRFFLPPYLGGQTEEVPLFFLLPYLGVQAVTLFLFDFGFRALAAATGWQTSRYLALGGAGGEGTDTLTASAGTAAGADEGAD